MNTIESQWKRLEALFNPGITELQRPEMRKCFFAGAAAMYQMAMRIVDEHDEDTVTKMFDFLEEELEAFDTQMLKELEEKFRKA